MFVDESIRELVSSGHWIELINSDFGIEILVMSQQNIDEMNK